MLSDRASIVVRTNWGLTSTPVPRPLDEMTCPKADSGHETNFGLSPRVGNADLARPKKTFIYLYASLLFKRSLYHIGKIFLLKELLKKIK